MPFWNVCVLIPTIQRTWGFPMTMRRALALLMATLNLLGLLKNPKLCLVSNPTKDSFDRTCKKGRKVYSFDNCHFFTFSKVWSLLEYTLRFSSLKWLEKSPNALKRRPRQRRQHFIYLLVLVWHILKHLEDKKLWFAHVLVNGFASFFFTQFENSVQ